VLIEATCSRGTSWRAGVKNGTQAGGEKQKNSVRIWRITRSGTCQWQESEKKGVGTRTTRREGVNLDNLKIITEAGFIDRGLNSQDGVKDLKRCGWPGRLTRDREESDAVKNHALNGEWTRAKGKDQGKGAGLDGGDFPPCETPRVRRCQGPYWG